MTSSGDADPMNRFESDEELIKHVLDGDKDLFRELVERHKNIVFSSLVRLCGNRELAEELTQETFVKAYTHLARFRFEARFSTWLVQIAANTASSYFSSRGFRERQRAVLFDHDLPAGQFESAERQLELQSRLARYWRAIEKLDDRLREVLLLCGIEGNPYDEVAELLGVPVGTVRSRLNKARQEMRKRVSVQERRS